MSAISSLPYFGGKSPRSPNTKQVCHFVAKALPIKKGYLEPFAGMAGVLLARPPANVETLNDKDEFVMNWWRVVRYQPELLTRMILYTTRSEKEFSRAKALLKAWSPPSPSKGCLETAWAFYITTKFSLLHSMGKKGGKFVAAYRADWTARGPVDVGNLCSRLARVQLLCQDACGLLERIAEMSDYSIYVDPPYKNAANDVYNTHSVDRDRLLAALLAQKGSVCLSGYDDEWDSTGWTKTEFPTTIRHFNKKGSGKNVLSKRTEVVWMNFQPKTNNLF